MQVTIFTPFIIYNNSHRSVLLEQRVMLSDARGRGAFAPCQNVGNAGDGGGKTWCCGEKTRAGDEYDW